MKQQYKLLQGSLVYMVIYACAMAGLLIYIGKNTIIRVTEVSQEEISANVELDGCIDQAFEGQMVIVQKGEERDYIMIPLDGSMSSTDITAENLYLDKQVRVVLKKAESDFYNNLTITGNQTQIMNAFYHYAEEGMHLQFDLDDIYDIATQYERNALTIILEKPYRIYDKIVVIDPATQRMETEENSGKAVFSEAEKGITWDIACKVRDLLDAAGVKVYFSRTEQTESDCEKTIYLAEAVHADMLIRIETGASSDGEKFGTEVVYNERFFTPVLNNAFLADMLEREITSSIQGKVLGLKSGLPDNQLLLESKVPAAVVIPGYFSNDLEAILLDQEQYREKIAEGICHAVEAVYESEEKADE